MPLIYKKGEDIAVQAVRYASQAILREADLDTSQGLRDVQKEIKGAGLGIWTVIDLLSQASRNEGVAPCAVLPLSFTHSSSMDGETLERELRKIAGYSESTLGNNGDP